MTLKKKATAPKKAAIVQKPTVPVTYSANRKALEVFETKVNELEKHARTNSLPIPSKSDLITFMMKNASSIKVHEFFNQQ